jgi:hypothetical protein
MRYKALLSVYLLGLVLVVVVPLNELNVSLTNVFVLDLRLDYLLHMLLFVPLVPLWRLGFPRHSVWIVIGAGFALAIAVEGMQYALSYSLQKVLESVRAGRRLNILAMVSGNPTRANLSKSRSKRLVQKRADLKMTLEQTST